MRIRISPAFVVALLALVMAAGGTGFAAGKITSDQIKAGAIKSKHIKNKTITGVDVKNGSLPRAKLDRACAAGEEAVFGGCVRLASVGPSSFQGAIDNCNSRDGRLPTTLELFWIASHVEYQWADGNPSQYEFTGDYTDGAVYTPIAFDRATNPIPNASGGLFWHHCVTH